eukprot:357975-Chlamydomonas_euryale.AAC.2
MRPSIQLVIHGPPPPSSPPHHHTAHSAPLDTARAIGRTLMASLRRSLPVRYLRMRCGQCRQVVWADAHVRDNHTFARRETFVGPTPRTFHATLSRNASHFWCITRSKGW